MANIANLAVAISANSAELSSGLGRAEDSLSLFGGKMASVAAKAAGSLAIMGTAFATLKASMADIIGDQTSVTRLGLLIGNVEAADAVFSRMESRAIDLGLDPDEYTAAGIAMVKYGKSTAEAVDLMEKLANIADVTGTPLESLAETFGKVATQGGVTSKTLNKLALEAPMVSTEMQRLTGTSAEGFKQLASDGQVSMGLLMQALDNTAGKMGTFGKASEEMAGTVGREFQSMTDSIVDFGGSLLKTLKADYLMHQFADRFKRAREVLFGKDDSPLPDLKSKVVFGQADDGFGKDSAQKSAKAIETIISGLEKQAATFGMTASEVKLYEAAQAGANVAQITSVKSLTTLIDYRERERQQTEQAAAAAAALNSEIASTTTDLQKQVDTWGMSADAVKLYELRLKGANAEQIAGVKAMQDRLAKLNEEKDLMDLALKPDALDNWKADEPKKRTPQLAGALLAGSKDAYSVLVNDMARGKGGKDPQEEVRKEAVKINDNIKQSNVLLRQAVNVMARHGIKVGSI